MMTREKLADLQKEGHKNLADARDIAEKHDGEPHEWPTDVRDSYNEAMAKAAEVLERVKIAKSDLSIIEQARELGEKIGAPISTDRDELPAVRGRLKSLGVTVTDSPEFKACLQPYTHGGQVQIPKGAHVNSAPIQVKSLITGLDSASAGAFVVNERTNIVEMLGRKPLTVRDLVSKRRTASDVVEYVQEATHTNAAAIVPEATDVTTGAKPEGAWTFVVKSATVETIAEWVPITKRALADVGQLEGLINDELALDIAEKEEDTILNGTGAIKGILGTTGIQAPAFATDIFTSVRKGITLARTVGRVNPNAILFNPADAETVDLTKDGNNQYYYGGPQALGQRTLWGLPIVESESQPVGFATLGDFNKAVLWDREQTTVTMTDSHADFFVKNLVAILAEERIAFAVVRPAAFVKVDIATP